MVLRTARPAARMDNGCYCVSEYTLLLTTLHFSSSPQLQYGRDSLNLEACAKFLGIASEAPLSLPEGIFTAERYQSCSCRLLLLL